MSRVWLALRLGLRATWRERGGVALAILLTSLGLLVVDSLIAQAAPGGADTVSVVVHTPRERVDDGATTVTRGAPGAIVIRALGWETRGSTQKDGGGFQSTSTPAVTRGATVSAPAGSQVGSFPILDGRLVGDHRAVDVRIAAADLDGVAGSTIRVTTGRAPAGDGEIATSTLVARKLRIENGDVLYLERRRFRLVGTVTSSTGDAFALVAPGRLPEMSGRAYVVVLPQSTQDASAGMSSSSIETAAGTSDVPAPEMTWDSHGGANLGFVLLVVSLGIYGQLGLAIPLLLAVAVLAIGGARRHQESLLLEQAGITPALRIAVAAVRGGIIAVGATAVGVVGTVLIGAATDASTGDLVRVSAASGLAALPGCLIASIASARATRRLEGGSHGAAIRWRRELARVLVGFGALAFATGVGRSTGVSQAILTLAGIAGGIWGGVALARIAVTLPSALPLPAGVRAGARAVARARWVSAPAAVGAGLAAIALVGVSASGPSTDVSGVSQTASEVPSSFVAVLNDGRALVSGAPDTPRAAVAAIFPQAAAIVPGWEAIASACGMNVDDTVVTRLGGPSCYRPDANGPSRAGAPAAWLVKLPRGTTQQALYDAAITASDAGLALTSGAHRLDVSDTTGIGTLWMWIITVSIGLLFGGTACALVLFESREEPRRLLLAGAAPRTVRATAAVTGAALGIAALLVVGGLDGALAFGGNGINLTPLAPLLLLPPVLAGLSALLVRVPRRLT